MMEISLVQTSNEENIVPEVESLMEIRESQKQIANVSSNSTQTVEVKPDLKNTKTELFNKLIASQPQQMIVTTMSKPENSDDLFSIDSPNAGSSKQQSAAEVAQANQSQQQDLNQKQTVSTNTSDEQQQNEETKKCAVVFSRSRNRWYTNEEVSSILTNFSSHPEWQTNELQVRPKSGAVLLYSREKVRYRQDGYCWKKRKNGRTTREDHMKLKVQGIECIYGCYVHSAILPTFHRRCYWLLQNPDIVLVHYLNQPPDDQKKMMITFNSSLLEADTRRSWTNEEIIEEIGSVFGGISQIQQTLNINFPTPSAAIIQNTSQGQTVTNDLDRMIESSPQSQLSHSTTSSEILNEQTDTATTSNNNDQRLQAVSGTGKYYQTNNNSINREQDEDEDELMTTVSSQEEEDDEERREEKDGIKALDCAESNQQNNLNCKNNLYNGQPKLKDENETTSMTFELVDGTSSDIGSKLRADNESRHHHHHHQSIQNAQCFNYNNLNNTVNLVDDNNNINDKSHSNSEQLSSIQMEQNLCSPVTQIYNKIVDDIETYALPLEPNQYDSNSHHHNLSISSLPVQSMDLIDVSNQDCHHNQHHTCQSTLRGSRRVHPHPHLNETGPLEQQYLSCSNSRAGEQSSVKDMSACSMDFTDCDLFVEHGGSSRDVTNVARDVVGNCTNQSDNDDDASNILLANFNLPANGVGQVGDDLDSNVVDSLSHVDDLRDLMMGLSSNSVNAEHSNLLVDSNSLDLFNFKPIDCEHTLQQLDLKSSTSDTEALTRLSPSIPAPRCNSTGNAMQPCNLHPLNHQQHLSSNFLTTCAQDNVLSNTFCGFQSSINNNDNMNTATSHRSSSTYPTSSTSCSASPSSTSLQRAVTLESPCSNEIQYNGYATSTVNSQSGSQPFMKLPLQQRQRSEQQEPCNSILNSLLPKALSLDGSELSITAQQQFCSTSSPYSTMQDPDLLILPSSALVSQQQQQQQPSLLNHSNQQYKAAVIKQNPSEKQDVIFEQSMNRGQISYDNNNAQAIYSLKKTTSFDYNNLKTNLKLNNLLPILDYVPNWCNITGGAKVLIVGDWIGLTQNNVGPIEEQRNQSKVNKEKDCSSELFSAMFDDLVVPATMIQDNILRCYAPGHEPGFISLKILFMGRVVSEQVLFEMRPSCSRTIELDQGDTIGDKDNNSNNNTQHRDSTSSRQSSISSFLNQKPQTSPSGNSISADNSTTSSNKVLTLAENIISAMHRKNSHTRPFGSRLVNSLDIETHDHHRHSSLYSSQRFRSLKGTHRGRLTGSRSLSRESEPNSSLSYAMSFGIMENDPYWHQSLIDTDPMKPLSVVTDFFGSHHSNSTTNPMFNQQHSDNSAGSSSLSSSANQSSSSSAFMPYLRRPSLSLATHQVPQPPHHYHHHQLFEMQNMTETSSSGLGSIVSSLSPSPSSLHSPSSVCNPFRDSGRGFNQSSCSCECQSSGTPTSADFCEYFQASSKTEESFASLTLNDKEQQELYQAAKIIQKAYRTYRGRKRQASELLAEASGSLDIDFQTSSKMQHAQQEQVGNNFQQKLSTQTRNNSQHQQQQTVSGYLQQPVTKIKCYPDREMQAATIIQAYYRRYRQYAQFKRQSGANNNDKRANSMFNPNAIVAGYNVQPADHSNHDYQSLNAQLVVDTMPIIIDKATTSHVDRKRFKTAILISNNSSSNNNNQSHTSGGYTNIKKETEG